MIAENDFIIIFIIATIRFTFLLSNYIFSHIHMLFFLSIFVEYIYLFF